MYMAELQFGAPLTLPLSMEEVLAKRLIIISLARPDWKQTKNTSALQVNVRRSLYQRAVKLIIVAAIIVAAIATVVVVVVAVAVAVV